MKRKNTLLYIAIIIVILACLFVLSVKTLGLNIIKHHDTQLSGLTIKYYGGFNGINIVKVYDGAIRRGTFELSVSKDVIDSINKNPPYLYDLDRDGSEDLLIPHSSDKNGDIRYAVFFWKNNVSMYEASEILHDVANLKIDDDHSITSSVSLHTVIHPEENNLPEIYEDRTILTEFKLSPDGFKLLREYTLVYYSENDIYCYIKHDYNTDTGELVSAVEDWLTPEEASKIQLS